MTDDLMPAELALPEGVLAPISDEVLAALDDGGPQPSVPTLEGQDEAEWAMRRLARLLRSVTEHRAQRDAWKERVDDWYAETAGPAERRVAYLEETLKRYAVHERLRDPRRATVKVPSGEVWTRAEKAPRVVIDDEGALLGYLVSALDPDQWDAVVRTTQAVRVSELSKLVEVGVDPAADGALVVLYGGERVPGVHADPPATTSGVRPNYGPPALPE